jgi:hypothetical protein
MTLVGTGCWGTYETMFKLPREYSTLESRGIPLTATFAGCTAGRDATCTLELPGSRARWDYGENHAQFDGLSVGAPVAVMVDPKDPHTRYTAVDLRRHTNAGFGVLFAFSLALGIAGLAAIPFLLRFSREVIDAAE